jgi:hypothetical protein
MFTKTTLALALILGTASNALAATRHQNVAPSHDEVRVEKALAEQRDVTEFVVGNMLFVGFHELGPPGRAAAPAGSRARRGGRRLVRHVGPA